MTAVVGILNTSAVAIAADSAVTVANELGEKVFNTANKIFQLSKYQPVGIAVYNSANFLMTPWEVIIKMYRRQLKDRQFDTITDYKDDFVNYVTINDFFSEGPGIDQSIHTSVFNMLNGIMRGFMQNEARRVANLPPPEQQTAAIDAIKKIIRDQTQQYQGQAPHMGSYQQWSESELIQHIEQIIPLQDAINNHSLFDQGIVDAEFTSLFKTLLYAYLVSDNFNFSAHTGLVFVGYGEKEFFPHCLSIEIAEVLSGKMRWAERTDTVISEVLTASVEPFAQRDVIQTMMDGVAPDLRGFMSGQISGIVKSYQEAVINLVAQKDQQLAEQLRLFDTQQVLGQFDQRVKDFQKKFYVGPTLSAVDLFSKEDLAEMAESMIFLTYLKKRMTFTQENVSKPVDVAVISKGDGFIWVKRKYYFDQALNPHFLRTYFSEE
jgi:hypothetical protein